MILINYSFKRKGREKWGYHEASRRHFAVN